MAAFELGLKYEEFERYGRQEGTLEQKASCVEDRRTNEHGFLRKPTGMRAEDKRTQEWREV